MGLIIIHRNAGRVAAASLAPVWTTCLREVSFVEDVGAASADGDVLADGAAYRLLLEILCGLRSPMVGETQVMSQFKTFLAGLGPEHAWLGQLGRRLLADVRTIRERHLRGLGSRSYGSAVRRHVLDCERVALVGTGSLAQEILPFVADDGRSVDEWSRHAHDADRRRPGVAPRLLGVWAACPVAHEPAALVMAAPVPSRDVAHVASRYSTLRRVIDLRAQPEADALALTAPTITLQDLFDQMQAARDVASAQVGAAKAEIVSLSRAFSVQEQLRPFGWDDLCA